MKRPEPKTKARAPKQAPITLKEARRGIVLMEILGPPISKRGRSSKWR